MFLKMCLKYYKMFKNCDNIIYRCGYIYLILFFLNPMYSVATSTINFKYDTCIMFYVGSLGIKYIYASVISQCSGK